MQLLVSAVGPQKTSQYGEYFSIKSGDAWYNVRGTQDKSLKGKTVEVEGKQTQSGWWGRLKGEASTQTQPLPNGKTRLNQFVMAEAVDFWWERIKPFELADDAKASVLCTLLIATADGRVNYELPPEVPEEDPFE